VERANKRRKADHRNHDKLDNYRMSGCVGVGAVPVFGLNTFHSQFSVVVERVEAGKGARPAVYVAVPGVDGEFRPGQG